MPARLDRLPRSGFIAVDKVPYFIFLFALGNLLGPILLGRYFDTIGRRAMVGGSYCVAAVLLFVTGWLFNADVLTATTQTLLWCVVFAMSVLVGGLIEFAWGFDAERRPLEAVATPLSVRAVTAAAESGLTGGLTSHVRRAWS